jgi:glycosyltransferase involved in cell wall biosynthesis
MGEELPLVTVLTPVFNGEEYLAECIESVLSQTYKNWEYIIVNNCSTDGTQAIAERYAKTDVRIRVHNGEEFVDVIENHNRAFRLISPASKYCKVVSGDDWIYPECVARMVEVAEASPSVGIVGCYQLSGSRVLWQGFRHPRAVIAGRELGRQIFLGDDPSFGCGSPTSLLYRADLVRDSEAFYPNPSPHSDTSACFDQLRKCDFGFVYQVLSYERVHQQRQSATSAGINRYTSATLNDLLVYGPFYLSEEELKRKVKGVLNRYYRFLALNLPAGRGKEFWGYHDSRLRELGYPITRLKLLQALVKAALSELANPGQAVRKFLKRYFPKQTCAVSDSQERD